MLAEGEFHLIANLVYLTLDNNYFPQNAPENSLQFEAQAIESPERLGPLLLETYVGSLDCPALNGIRDPADIIKGYASQGTMHSDCWFFIRHVQQDVGTLILTSHANGENWELVYMGIVPSARGSGFGWQTLQQAMWQAHKNNAKRLVLAVDESNEPALQNYRKAGFVVWDRKKVYARLRSQL